MAERSHPPIHWSETENIKWKVPLPGKGHASPVVWGDRIFIATAIPIDREETVFEMDQELGSIIPVGHKFDLLCIDRNSGETLWRKTALEAIPNEGYNLAKGSYSCATPATDGEHVYAFFGSQGVYCYDFDGNLKWDRDLGDFEIIYQHGYGSSPILHEDKLILIVDQEGQSFITALEKTTGKELWRTLRDEPSNWTSPVIVEHNGRTQIVTNGSTSLRGYDADSGEVIWEYGRGTLGAIPTIVTGHGLAIATSGYQGNFLKAIDLDSRGDITESEVAVVWSLDKATPYVPSPLLAGEELYVLNDRGIISCLDAASGKVHYGPERMRLWGATTFLASPVASAKHIYLLTEGGLVVVLKRGRKLEIVSSIEMFERFTASPAIVGDELFLRSDQHLYCISEG